MTAWEMCYCVVVTEAGSYLRLIDSCITQPLPRDTCAGGRTGDRVTGLPRS